MNYTVEALRDHRYAQCAVKLHDTGDLVLRSYSTDVLYYRKATRTLYCSGLYSATTRRHIVWFLREYLPKISYQNVKAAYENDCSVWLSDSGLALRELPDSEKETLRSASHGASLYPSDFWEVQANG